MARWAISQIVWLRHVFPAFGRKSFASARVLRVKALAARYAHALLPMKLTPMLKTTRPNIDAEWPTRSELGASLPTLRARGRDWYEGASRAAVSSDTRWFKAGRQRKTTMRYHTLIDDADGA